MHIIRSLPSIWQGFFAGRTQDPNQNLLINMLFLFKKEEYNKKKPEICNNIFERLTFKYGCNALMTFGGMFSLSKFSNLCKNLSTAPIICYDGDTQT